MLTKQAKTELREELFRHLDGIAVAPVAHQFFKRNISKYILSTKQHKLSEVSKFFNANEGYLNVALRVLASQGWVEYTINNSTNEVLIQLNERSETAFSLFKYYGFAVEFLELSRNFHPKESNPADFYKIQKLLEEFQSISFSSSENSLQNEIQHQVFKHLEGALVGPLTVALAMNGFFHKYFMEVSFRAEEYHEDPESFRKILDFYTFLNWFEKKEHTYTFTDKGLFFAKRASAYGVTVSYIPTFNNIEDVLFGNYATIRENPKNKTEIHVDRVMNVWGSGGAHTAYFREIDDIIIEIFNKPIDEQPKGILDMGCGNGAFLIHLFDVIEQRTLRGTLLEDYPLFLVGVDFNKEALKVTRSNLVNADIWAKVIWGDIGDPDQLENRIYQDYSIHLGELLNVRTFLDHNRIWTQPKDTNQTASGKSTGAFAFRGKKLNNNLVALNLKEHFQKWEPYIKKHGLLLIELHTLPPGLASKNIGKTAVTAYDATHGFSDQYIVELDVFLNVLNEIGLKSKKKYFSKYPNTELATVSIHYIKK
ncbi:class I SAM-dependent methyltransferase [uncultured Planktosalinus sp.]|uniref:class I SAM-dependent methyltransferase n=1 Tax=uncultured Planktosalinus sp. TaxID=1810935 RepID=UPI0030D715A1